MTSDRPGDRRYNEQEVSLILQKAAEAQLRAPERGSGVTPHEGMSLVELEAIAAEAGLDVAHVRRAAMQLGAPPASSGGGRIVGGPTRLTAERVVDGEIPVSAFDVVAEEIRRQAGHRGRVVVRGRSLTCTLRTLSGSVTVSVSPRFGATSIHADAQLGDLAVGVFTGMGFGGLVGGIASAMAIAATVGMTGDLAAGLTVLATAGPYLLGRGIFHRKVVDAERQLHQLVDAVARCVASAVADDASDRPAP